jgi:hypothetical protein
MADTVGVGLFTGAMASIFVVLGGAALFVARDQKGEYLFTYFTQGSGIFWWMLILTSLLVGTLIYVKFINDYFSQLPKQIQNANVT